MHALEVPRIKVEESVVSNNETTELRIVKLAGMLFQEV